MSKYISIDPGRCKCGLVVVDQNEKKVDHAIVLKSDLLVEHIQSLIDVEVIPKIIIGNGTSSQENIEKLDFLEKELIVFEEKNTTYRAKQRYFELFPINWYQTLIPRDFYLMNKNLDAVSALIILEDYCNEKFKLSENIDIKTLLK